MVLRLELEAVALEGCLLGSRSHRQLHRRRVGKGEREREKCQILLNHAY